jgi:hypothetical protein
MKAIESRAESGFGFEEPPKFCLTQGIRSEAIAVADAIADTDLQTQSFPELS